MKVVLLEDVKSLGKKGELVNVSDGYARNFIIPKKLGLEATAKNLNDLKLQKKNEEKKQQNILEEAKAQAAEIEKHPVKVSVKMGEGGKVFGSVSTKEIVKAYQEQYKTELDKKKMQLDEPIKTAGTHIVQIKLHKDVTAKLEVKVTES